MLVGIWTISLVKGVSWLGCVTIESVEDDMFSVTGGDEPLLTGYVPTPVKASFAVSSTTIPSGV
jgi:hypothetical protein